MAEFTAHLRRLKPSQPFIQMDMNMQLLKQLPKLNPSTLENFSATDFSVDSFLAHHQPPIEFLARFDHNGLPSAFHHPEILNSATIVHAATSTSSQNVFPDSCKKRKAEAQSTSGSKNISRTASTTNTKKKNACLYLVFDVFQKLGRGKKEKNKEKEVDKAEEVIHVRAKRGQTTDSHGLAERRVGRKDCHKNKSLKNNKGLIQNLNKKEIKVSKEALLKIEKINKVTKSEYNGGY
ncbi:transcription factor BEE 3-like [Hevea brasiliensis]|uniref:transcription factor BEE 3-like n=1 Tax=Hevea brasiliensis TaxID=3981 RepID=UPI0025EE73D3|nr:transcription factor BEE 3-like [Hevea brasiliensis]